MKLKKRKTSVSASLSQNHSKSFNKLMINFFCTFSSQNYYYEISIFLFPQVTKTNIINGSKCSKLLSSSSSLFNVIISLNSDFSRSLHLYVDIPYQWYHMAIIDIIEFAILQNIISYYIMY